MADAMGDKEGFEKAAPRVKSAAAEYKQYSQDHNLPTYLDRMQAMEYNRSVAGKANWVAKSYDYKKYSGYLGTKTISQTEKHVKQIIYDGDKELLEGYIKAVKKGNIHALVDFDVYRKIAKEAEAELVGLTAVNGTTVKGFTTHFIDRVIGQVSTPHENKRLGMSIEDVKNTLLYGTPQRIRVSIKGKISQQIKGSNNSVSINPETGMLIQTNPRK